MATKEVLLPLVDQSFLEDITNPHWLKLVKISLVTKHFQREMLETSLTASGESLVAQPPLNLGSVKNVRSEFWLCPSIISI
jgi:hypothetical protein